VLHVMHSVMIERSMVSSQIYIDQIMKDARKLADKAAEETMSKIKKSCPELTVSKELKEGDAIREIISFAEEWKANMIVMGSHGREGIGRVVLGSVAYSVLAKAPAKPSFWACPMWKKSMMIPGRKLPLQ
ncbi:MAG TPA: universal stress protein, partial [Candidatus Melainabacteria bacterium]|nr:universal stress protein [Candidatus Melainabacteria bacterium]